MDINVSYYTSKGMRECNEDAVSILESNHNTLAVIADGLGGHEGGEVASVQVINTLNSMLQRSMLREEDLTEAIVQANNEILKLQDENVKMRSTIAALWIHDIWAVTATVGDTRVYQIRDGKITFQSRDHSVAQMAVLVGELNPEDIRSSNDRNKLIRVLGEETPPKIDIKRLTIQSGDRFLLCSDGFWNVVTEEDMLDCIGSEDTPQKWLGKMRRKIEELSDEKQDNHTAIAMIIQ